MRRTAAVLVLALLGSTACAGGLTHNHKQGFAVVGGLGVLSGSLVMIDGMSCDDAGWHNATCTHDNHELAVGGATLVAGAALFGWAVYLLSHEDKSASADAAPAATKTAATK